MKSNLQLKIKIANLARNWWVFIQTNLMLCRRNVCVLSSSSTATVFVVAIDTTISRGLGGGTGQ